MPHVRVLVVDDSSTQRAMLIRLLEQDPEIEVVGWAATGVDALRSVERLQPDVITLDDRMPGMSGLETARRIMRDWPTPIVMVSAAAEQVSQAAIAAGVVAVHDKRALGGADPAAPSALIRAIKSMSSVRVVRRRREPTAHTAAVVGPLPPLSQLRTGTPEIVAIGASTGGPQALRDILSRLPASFPVPVLVVQHTTAGYSKNLVDWLEASSALPVRVAEDGHPLDKPAVYVAPTQQHLVVRGRHLSLLDTPPVSLHRPSATVLFRSVAHAYGGRAVGVLLTGMGDDGAVGLAEMKRAGATTVAQDESTCVVFGMPAEAIRLGAADHVLPTTRIPGLLMKLTARNEAA